MRTYIILLRGINVSGKNILKMDAFKKVLTNYDFTDVKTYIQSGNIVLNTTLDKPNLVSEKIKDILNKNFDLNVTIITINPNQLSTILLENPYSQENNKEQYFTFLEKQPSLEKILGLQKLEFSNDTFKIINTCIYIRCINGYGKTKLTTVFFEKKLATNATTRNLRTLLKLKELSVSPIKNAQLIK